MSLSAIWPDLRAGDRIAIVAPSGPFDLEAFEHGRALLGSRYSLSVRSDIGQRAGYLAGDDRRRAEELLQALADPDVRALIAARGGYGATRLLSTIDREAIDLLRRDPKLLVGFSDITALHALWHRAEVGSLHASMVARVGRLSPPLQQRWLKALETPPSPSLTGLLGLTTGRARGPLFGGNLAVVSALLGTRHLPDLRGRVLFFEDVHERPYRIDRMLTSLRDAGVLEAAAGIALGRFDDCKPGPDGTELDAVLRERLSDLPIPVVSGLPAGHVDDNLELALGREVQIDADAGTLCSLAGGARRFG